jgi:hypothetical protein
VCLNRREIRTFKILVAKPERKRVLGRPGRKLENNLKMDIKNESLTAEREQVRKIHNMSFRHLGILLLQTNTRMVTHIVNFSDLFPFCS